MSVVALVASILVGLAFVLAGASKLAAGDGWAAQAEGLGAPPFTVRIVPWFELTLGAALIAQLGEPVPAIVAIVSSRTVSLRGEAATLRKSSAGAQTKNTSRTRRPFTSASRRRARRRP